MQLSADVGESHGGAAPARILVVEDERVVAHDLADSLVELGYVVVDIVATGEQAIERSAAARPSVVLMDIRLGGAVDGIEAAVRIHAQIDVPIIFLTAHSDDHTLQRAKHTYPLAYLVKPFREAELRCAIEIAIHRHEIDARLRVREQWLATTLRSIGDGVVVTDADQRVTLLNPVAEALTGWKHHEALGRALGDIMTIMTAQTGETVASPMGRALAQKGATNLQDGTLLVAKDGASTPIADSAAAMLDDHGELIGGVMVFRDVTKQRRMDREIQRLNEELEHRVVERTRQLEAANKELEAFSYSVAHNLRSPLRGIDGFSQLLIEEHARNLGPAGVEHLCRVRRAAQHMATLIDDLLQLARVARMDLERRPVDLSQLARTVTAGLRNAHPRREIEVAIQDGMVVEGDERLLQVVLENLIGNAWKFTSKVARATIEVGAMDQDAVRIHFVRDNGAGFSMQHADKLFGTFQRLHADSEFEGTGIGLAIVQRIIVRHGGQIWAEGAVGEGATFSFVV